MTICNNNDNNGGNEGDPPCWPTAAASRIKILIKSKADNQTSHCRLFYNRTTGAIELVHCHDNDNDDATAQQQQQQRTIYDDSDTNIENEPSYQSYVATSTDEHRIVVDSFHPNDVIGANLSLEYNANNPNTFHGMATYAVAKFNIYSYPRKPSSKGKNKNGKRSARHKHYTLDSKCCEDFADARSILQTIQKLSKLHNTTNNNNNNNKNNNQRKKAPSKFLVILNPFSGGGGPNSKSGARNVYLKIVKPMLEEASVEHDALVTERGGHARERMYVREKSNDGKSNDGVRDGARDDDDDGDDDDDDDEVEDSTPSQRNNDNESTESKRDSITTDDETKDISEYDAIIAMGGDGIQFEIFQGIHDRSCSQSSSSSSTTTTESNSNDSNNDDNALETILSKLKFGIVACGTYNGLVKSLLHWSACHDDGNDNNNGNSNFDCVESVFQICKGYASTLDVAAYKVLSDTATATGTDVNANNSTNPTTAITTATAKTTTTTTTAKSKSYLSFLSFAWGLIADCDFESECLRWLGPLRSDIWAVYRGILFRRQYRGRFSYLPPATRGDGSTGEGAMMEDKDDDGDVVVEMPQVGKPLPDGWVSFEEEFLVFWVCNTSHAAYNMYTCPMARMNDGLFHVLIVRSSCSRLRLLQMLLKLDSGGHIDCDVCEVIDCVAYQFEPLSNVSYNVLDGELLEDGIVQARFIPSGAQFFCGEK